MAVGHDLDPLILDLLEWLEREPRSVADVIDVWRSSCPRLMVWEDTVDRGFASRKQSRGKHATVELTAAGRDFLRAHRSFQPGGAPDRPGV